MATLQEIRELFRDSNLQEKVESALVIAAENLISGTPTADQQKWAAEATQNTGAEAKKALKLVLAKFGDPTDTNLSVAAIIAATDSSWVTEVTAVVPSLVVAYNASIV